jgi:DNA-binding transcriptional regulator YdaS (Cro superfamily)
MDLNALTVFREVAEAGGFRAAADRLGVTPSAVSQTIGKREESLCVVIEATGAWGEHLCGLLRPVGAAAFDLGEQDEARGQQQCAIHWVKRQGQRRGGRCKRDLAQIKQTVQPGPPAKAAQSGDGDSAAQQGEHGQRQRAADSDVRAP